MRKEVHNGQFVVEKKQNAKISKIYISPKDILQIIQLLKTNFRLYKTKKSMFENIHNVKNFRKSRHNVRKTLKGGSKSLDFVFI